MHIQLSACLRCKHVCVYAASFECIEAIFGLNFILYLIIVITETVERTKRNRKLAGNIQKGNECVGVWEPKTSSHSHIHNHMDAMSVTTNCVNERTNERIQCGRKRMEMTFCANAQIPSNGKCVVNTQLNRLAWRILCARLWYIPCFFLLLWINSMVRQFGRLTFATHSYAFEWRFITFIRRYFCQNSIPAIYYAKYGSLRGQFGNWSDLYKLRFIEKTIAINRLRCILLRTALPQKHNEKNKRGKRPFTTAMQTHIHTRCDRSCVQYIAQAGKFLSDRAKKYMPFLSFSWLCLRCFFFLLHVPFVDFSSN